MAVMQTEFPQIKAYKNEIAKNMIENAFSYNWICFCYLI